MSGSFFDLQGWEVSSRWMSFDVCLERMRMSEFLLWFQLLEEDKLEVLSSTRSIQEMEAIDD